LHTLVVIEYLAVLRNPGLAKSANSQLILR